MRNRCARNRFSKPGRALPRQTASSSTAGNEASATHNKYLSKEEINNADETREQPERADRNEHPTNRVAAGVGSCARAAAREGESLDPRARCAGRRASADAMAGGGEAVRIRRAQGQGEPARFVRRPSSVDRVPRLLRAGRARLAGACLHW